MIVHDLGQGAVRAMAQVDLVALGREPESPIGNFSFHDCLCGVGAFVGQPSWEKHTKGDELLFVLAGESELTILEGKSRTTQTITAGALVVVPRACWHRNDAPSGVTFLYITPEDGNEHSWDDPVPT
jgi:mannose-6-phosphate isomerase-like protein (cupin superfamily)